MKITILGAHGNIAMHMHPMFIKNGHQVRGLIRKQEQSEELKNLGVEPVICDVEKEEDISEAVGNVDAVVFAAGAGPGSGADRKWTVDRDGAVKLIEAAKKNGIDRYVMISAMGLDEPRGSDVFQVYQKAKAKADEALRKSRLDYTIIKPGRLTDENGTGKVSLAPKLDPGEIPREDVATVLTKVLETPSLSGKTLDFISGDSTVDQAIKKVLE